MAEVNGAPKFQRLPTAVQPTHYTLELQPDLANFTFKGHVNITLNILESTKLLKFNAKELSFQSAEFQRENGEPETLSVSVDGTCETAEVRLGSAAEPGRAQLRLDFTGCLNDTMHGFYRSQYKDQQGNTQYMATTQFESTYARKAFPCWDEPIYRAKFLVAMVVPEAKTALSNMNVESEKSIGDGLKRVQYAESPLMPSYLAAFIVGEFDYIEQKTKTGVTVRVYTLPTKTEQGKFSLEVAVKALEFYDDFFTVPYPLPKCDLIAIPDFSMAAMENWGLVTYREVCLLLDPEKTSVSNKAQIALTVGHELAHMWFGNLVTMKWWTDLWLKEGFATFCEYVFVGECYPEFHIWLQFANDEVARAMGLDALKSSHPIEVPIKNPNELEEIYDHVSYAKSASVIRMLHSHLSHKTFQDGLKHYLAKFQFGNAETADLWKALSESSGQDVAKMMASWTQKMGFPLVSISTRNEGLDTILTLKQKRFLADGSQANDGVVWSIPIGVSTAGAPNETGHKFLMDKEQMEYRLAGVPQDHWVKLNAGLSGYYRVQYSQDMLEKLLPPLRDQLLSTIDRLNLITDIFALVNAGLVPATQFLEVVMACAVKEEQFSVWDEINMGIGVLANVLARDTNISPKFDAFIRKTYGTLANKMGWEPKPGEGYHAARLRSLVFGRLGKANDPETIAKATEIYRQYREAGAKLNPDLRDMVFGIVARNGGAEKLKEFCQLFETSDFSEEQESCLLALAASPDPDVQRQALDYAMEKVRSQDLPWAFLSGTASVAGQGFVWNFFKEVKDQLLCKYGGANSNLFQAAFKISCGNHCQEEIAKEAETFFSGSEWSSVMDRPCRQSAEKIRLKAALLQNNRDPVDQWLQANGFHQ